MGLTSAMFTGLSGLNSNQLRIDTVGDNVANVNTTAFKSARAMFENQFSLTLAQGTGPSSTSGGTNPSQLGLGSVLGSIQRNLTAGSIETTGVPTDMAIEGAGYFIVRTPSADQAYTRDGTFKVDANKVLVSSQGYAVQGYGVDSNFNIVPGALTDLRIPLGTLSTARATTRAGLDGNLNANGILAGQGSVLFTQAYQTGGGAPATGATLLTDLRDPAAGAVPLFAVGDVITLANAKKGGREVPDATFTVTAGATLDDFTAFLQNNLGINTDPAAGGTPGVRVSGGSIVIEGNRGLDNAIAMDLSSIRSTNAAFPTPFDFTEVQSATGESVYTSFIAYDSLGTPVQVDLTMTLESKSTAGNTWRFYAESRHDTDASPVLGPTGTLTFDADGRLIAVTNTTIQVTRQNTGAVSPLQIALDFSNVTGLTSEVSTLVTTTQDGYGSGTLTGFSVGTDGVITGTFSNGLTRNLGQLALATFTNPDGLVSATDNLYLVGANSGQPVITTPQTLGAGKVLAGALELSNVDLTREFIGLITATTGFSASGRVISTSNDLLNELLLIAR
ncbi:MAG: flagellar hook-basal body complex protein [Phycisphaerae bacterium]|jgi:flagellar hook protein FlgE